MEPLKDSGSNIYPGVRRLVPERRRHATRCSSATTTATRRKSLDIPIGPDNKIEPGGPDQGQPTHFEVGRGWGTIAIKVPKDFGDKKLVWTLTANGKTVSVPFGVIKGYQIEPFLDAAMGNKPPVIKFSETGDALTGPPAPLAAAAVVSGVVGENVADQILGDRRRQRRDADRSRRRRAAARRGCRRAGAPAARPRVSTTLTQVPRSRRDQVCRQHAGDREGHGQHDRDVLAAG